MSKVFQPKKKIENQQYDSYWKLTVEYTDIYDRRFNNTLKTIVKFIDDKDLTKQEYQKEYYKELQEQIYIMYPKSDYASIRKSINQFIKLGFIKPFFKGYHTLTKKFLNTTVQEEKRSIFSQIFYENSSFNSSTTTDSTNIKETNFLLKTLAYHPDKKLSRNDIIALMVTPGISEISKGYLTKDELEEQYQYSKIINFEENKYNQISYLFTFLNLMPNIKADKNVGIHFIDPNEVEIDTKRDPILYGIYKNDLDNESIRLYGKKICYIQKTPYKGLVHSHIKDSGVCLDEGKIAQTWIMVSLLIGKQPDLYHALEILRNDPRVWFNTSWDISGRFKSEKMHRTWASHMLEIHRLYPRVNLNTTMILTQDLVKAYILGRFSFRDFCERYHTHLFLKPPAYNDLTEEIYCQRHPELANSSFDLPHNKLMFAELINNLNFFPKRSDFLSFLMKFKQDMGEVAYRDLFNIERRADDLYVTKSDGHTIKKCHREKQGNGFGDRENSLSTCGHSTYYAVYGDSDACMLCDKEYIGSL